MSTSRGLSRRQLATAALAGVTGCAHRPAGMPPEVIDTHTHFYDPRRPGGVPWPAPSDRFLHRPVLPPEYERLAHAVGISSTIVVEASSWLEDNAWVLALADEHRIIAGTVGHLPVGTPAFLPALTRFRADRRFRGVRIGGGVVQRALAEPELRRDLGRLADANLAVDVLCGPEALPDVVTLAGALAELRIVLDHVGNVPVDGRPPPDGWRRSIDALGACANVYCKASGLVEGASSAGRSAPSAPAHYRAVLDAVWTAFGEDRVMFASNWPVSARFGSLATVTDIARTYVADRAPAAAPKFFAKNARRAYALG